MKQKLLEIRNSIYAGITTPGLNKAAFYSFLVLAAMAFVPYAGAQVSVQPGAFGAQGSQAVTQFGQLRTQLQGFAVVILMIMLVIAAIMAAMQKVTMAINVAIAAIILFGGGYIMLLIYSGLGNG